MKDKLKEFIKFTTSSLTSTVVDLGLFAIFVYFLKNVTPTFYILMATVIARIVAILVNYNLNATMVFPENEKRKQSFAKYIALAVVDMLASALFVHLLSQYFIWNETLTKMLVDGTLFFVGYVIQRKYIF